MKLVPGALLCLYFVANFPCLQLMTAYTYLNDIEDAEHD